MTNKWILYKEFGKYKVTREINADNYMGSNMFHTTTLHDCNNIEDAYKCLEQNGWDVNEVINRTGEERGRT